MPERSRLLPDGITLVLVFCPPVWKVPAPGDPVWASVWFPFVVAGFAVRVDLPLHEVLWVCSGWPCSDGNPGGFFSYGSDDGCFCVHSVSAIRIWDASTTDSTWVMSGVMVWRIRPDTTTVCPGGRAIGETNDVWSPLRSISVS